MIGRKVITTEDHQHPVMRSHEIHWELQELHLAAATDASNAFKGRWRFWPGKTPEPLRVAYLVCSAEGVIGNGGFRYFFENDWPDRISYRQFERAYRAIGMDQAADLLAQAAALFPFNNPEKYCDRRRAILDEMEARDEETEIDRLGTLMIDIGGEIVTQLVSYCSRYADHFPELVARKAQLDDERTNWRTKP